METKKRLTGSEKVAFGLGAVGKDMCYMFSATYILYYFQDVMGVSAVAMGIILLIARIFDAFNDPIMGIVVAKTKTKWGKFRPWLLIGTITNAVILVLMFSCPPSLDGKGLVAYAAVTYILWGVTYTMMDIPYWSMIPAFTAAGKEREGLSALGRTCAGVGSALISVVTVLSVKFLGNLGTDGSEYERIGYQRFSIIVAACFIIFIAITCAVVKEKSTVDMEAVSVGQMFKSLVKNDQAMAMVITTVCTQLALYITTNLVIYFFKYDFSPENWESNYTIFSTAGGAFQILAMMAIFPLLRKFMTTIKVFYTALFSVIAGYIVLLILAFSGMENVYLLLIPVFLIMGALGLMNVINTVFLANTCDYGELKNGRRDESVIFSMQTFVVKLGSGIAAFIASLVLTIFNITEDTAGADTANVVYQRASESSCLGLRMSMTVIPIIIIIIAMIVFKTKYKLTDEKLDEINKELEARKAAAGENSAEA